MAWEDALIIGAVGFAALMFYLSFKIDEKHSYLRIFFFFLGYYGVMGLFHLLSEMVQASAAGQTGIINYLDHMYSSLTYILFFLAVYFFVVYFIFGLVISRIRWQKKRKDEFEL